MTPFLASFVPDWVLRRLETDPAPPRAPWAERVDAAVLFADLSGFTPLAERLAASGTAGAERLGEILDSLTTRQVALVSAHGGDVFGFAGDAALAVWPLPAEAGGEGLGRGVRLAVQCGSAMQDAVAGLESLAGARLRLRVGIGAGRVLLATTGGAGAHCEAYVAGAALVGMAAAERVAAPGEVALSARAARLAGAALDLGPAADGCMRVTSVRTREPLPLASRSVPPAEAVEALRAFVPHAVLARLDAGQTEWLAEFRRVLTLFVNVDGIDYEGEAAPIRVAEAVSAMSAVVARFDGTVHQFIVDDKGSTFLAAWGLPGRTHEDDAARAAQAALDIRVALAGLGLSGSAGLTSGRVFSGTKGSDARRVFTIAGDAVNLSARLMTAAHGGILVDAPTRDAAARQVAFEPMGAIPVKGKEEPVPVARPLGPHGGRDGAAAGTGVRGAADGEMVGRTGERGLVAAELKSLADGGPGGLLVIEGEPGIGKSRLAQELVRLAGLQGVRCLVGAGDAIEQSTPNHAWRGLFGQLLELEGVPEAARAARVLARFEGDPGLAAWAPVLGSLAPIGIPETAQTLTMTDQARADALRELLVLLVRDQAGRRPTALVLEDAHWLDSSSWALALAVRRRVHPLLLVLVTRPIESPPTLESRVLLEDAAARRLRLEALTPAEAVTLVCRRLGVPSLPGPVSEIIRRKAEGHPFFTEELTYALRDSGVIRVENGACVLSPDAGDLARMQFPDTVEGVITTRIDRLGAKEQLTLKVASVVGRSFPYRALHAVHPVAEDRPELPGQLLRLGNVGLVLEEAPFPDASHLFKHVITQEVAYERLLHAQRRQLHREVAGWYESAFSSDASPYFPVLAHHWTRAEDPVKAMDYLERAGEQALAASANREAAGFFSRAIEMADRAALALDGGGAREALERRRARWERLQGDAYLKLAEYGRTREHFARSMALWRHPYPRSRFALLLALAGQVVRQGLHLLLPAGWVRARNAAAREAAQEVSLMHQRQAEIFYFEQSMLPLLHATFANLNFAERAGTSAELTLAYATVAIVAGLSGLHPLARLYSARAVSCAETVTESRDLPAVAYSWLLRGVYIYSTGDWAEGEKYYRKSMALFDRLGDRYRWENANTSIGWQELFRGRFVSARRYFRSSLESAQRDGTAKMRMWALASDLAATLPSAVPDPSVVCALEEELRHPLDKGDRVFGQGMRAAAWWALGEAGRAEEAAGDAGALLSGTPPSTAYCAHGVFGAFETFLALADRARAAGDAAGEKRCERWARQASLVLRVLAFQNPIVAPRSLLVRGRLAVRFGRPSRALRLWRRALGQAERMGLVLDEALAAAGIARHGAGPEARTAGERAEARARELALRVPAFPA